MLSEGVSMRLIRIAIATGAVAFASAAQATTVIVFVEPMTMARHTRVIDTPGPDRFVMCVEPPSVSGCTELPMKRKH